MWNILSGNRLIDKRRKEEAQRKHIIALNKVKPMVDNHTPNQYSFLYSRPKACQLKLQRQADIQSQNTILVEKMMRSTSYVRPRHEIFFKDTLNGEYLSRLSRKIDDGNQKLVRRLQQIKSQYCSVPKSTKQYDKYKSNMAFSRMDPFYDFQAPSGPKSQKKVRPESAKR